LLGLLEQFDIDIKAVYLDRGFYDGKCLTLLQAHNYAYVTPIIRWGDAIQDELDQGWSRTIEHDLTMEFDSHEWTVEFPVYIDCTYQNGRYNEHGVARHGYTVDAPFIDTPRQARENYSKRFGLVSLVHRHRNTVFRHARRESPAPVGRLTLVAVAKQPPHARTSPKIYECPPRLHTRRTTIASVFGG
jgi:hypothetical protein